MPDAAGELGFVASGAAESLATIRSRNFAVVTPFSNRRFDANEELKSCIKMQYGAPFFLL